MSSHVQDEPVMPLVVVVNTGHIITDCGSLVDCRRLFNDVKCCSRQIVGGFQ